MLLLFGDLEGLILTGLICRSLGVSLRRWRKMMGCCICLPLLVRWELYWLLYGRPGRGSQWGCVILHHYGLDGFIDMIE